jgi:hypothetical protein
MLEDERSKTDAEARWQAWISKGRNQDEQMRARERITGVLIIICVAAAFVYLYGIRNPQSER